MEPGGAGGGLRSGNAAGHFVRGRYWYQAGFINDDKWPKL